MMVRDNEAFLAKIPKLDADGFERYSGIILEGRPGIGKTALSGSILPHVPRYRKIRVPMATRTYEEFGALPYPSKEKIDAYAFNEDGEILIEDGKKVKIEKEIVRVEQALSEVSIEPLLEENIGDDYGVLILDDVTLGDPRLQNALLELVQFGVIANRRLGKNVIIFLTGNKTDDNAYAIEWSAPLLGRCVKISVEPNFDLWLTYEDNQDICPTVVGFLKEFPKWFAPLSGDKDCTDESGRTPSPRDWTRLGRGMYQQGGYRKFEPDFVFTSPQVYSSSMTGDLAGQAYNQYAANFGVYPTSEELFADASLWNDVPMERKDMLSGCIAVIFGLKNHATKLLEKSITDNEELYNIIDTLFELTLLVSGDKRELVGFILNGINTWAKEDPKTRKNVMGAAAKVITQDKYKNNQDFRNFIAAQWKYSNKS